MLSRTEAPKVPQQTGGDGGGWEGGKGIMGQRSSGPPNLRGWEDIIVNFAIVYIKCESEVKALFTWINYV